MNPITPQFAMPSSPEIGAVFAAKNLFQSTEFYLTVGSLVGVLLVGAVVIHYLDRWRNKQLSNDEDSPLTLSQYRKLYEQGELSEEEYTKVRDRIAARMKQGTPMTLKPPAVVESPKEPPRPPDPESS